jgi:cell wall-associated NlpC family hydrolase
VIKQVATSSGSSKRAKALSVARAQLGKPYVYGASGPNAFDCSGLVQFAYKAVGINLPRVSRDQAKVGQLVSKADLQPGDLVFFYSPVSHVGIYVGDGKMLNAPNRKSQVRIQPMNGFKFSHARRVTG